MRFFAEIKVHFLFIIAVILEKGTGTEQKKQLELKREGP